MKRYLWPIISLIIAAGLQGNLPKAISIFGAMPDLVFVVLIAYSLAEDPEFGATLGFVAGLIHGCAVGLSLGSFIVTRTFAGFVAGFLPTRLFSENFVVPMISAVWLTAACECLFLLANPRWELNVVVWTVAGECIENAIFTLFLYLILRQFNTSRKIRLANARI